MNHNSYITVKRAKFKTISGEVNIPYGTKLEVGGNVSADERFSGIPAEYRQGGFHR